VRVVAIHQPNYLPGLRLFDKLIRADIFVWLDSVPYSKNNWTNRNRIRSSNGVSWLTVPVLTTGRLMQSIAVARTDGSKWRSKHLKALQASYGRAPYGSALIKAMRPVYEDVSEDRLAEINLALTAVAVDWLDIRTPVARARDLDLPVGLGASELLLAICRRTEADTYVSGAGGRHYLDLALFERANVRVVFQEFVHPQYPQIHGEFQPDLSVVDLLANLGTEARSIFPEGASISWP
jgi:hypothetical protein